MTPSAVEKFCLSLPGVSVDVKWGADRCYLVGEKMFAVTPMGVKTPSISFKCSDVGFELLTKQKGVVPAPYLARAKWVQVETLKTLSVEELKARLAESHRLVMASLTKKKQCEILEK